MQLMECVVRGCLTLPPTIRGDRCGLILLIRVKGFPLTFNRAFLSHFSPLNRLVRVPDWAWKQYDGSLRIAIRAPFYLTQNQEEPASRFVCRWPNDDRTQTAVWVQQNLEMVARLMEPSS